MLNRPTGTAVLAGAVLVAAGGVAGFLLRPAGPPPDLAAADTITSAPVAEEKYADERTVQVTLNLSPAADLTVGTAGRVTSTGCAAGGTVESGTVPVRVDGKRLIALATSVPLYRDLRWGHTGADVKALQTELARLGHPTPADGTFGRRTYEAVRSLKKANGWKNPDGEVAVDRFIWLPAAQVTVEECQAPLGAHLGKGGEFATVPGRVESARADSLPADAAPGERTLTVAGVSGPVSGEGVADDPGFLRELAATKEARAAQKGQDDPVSGSVALTEPLDALKVAPGALFGTSGDSGCLQEGDDTIPVRIVGSNLGSTLVVPEDEDGDVPDEVAVGTAITATSCAGDTS
ncbi:peptidoglycan hydrolase-like protein with peptidoglycan-binding domain [Nocardiopsis mwathae]|uniref:Peptidoglycan hydrolase-like protein with peptidoglycan-binding domain n=1 Tax=Nocardiopsis mwathae TaxID=1472723 RepID=A0A7W9YDA6_9ACTN|nr:peptidoglycan-binding protein [Nocardiopsis mwathae]MBB6170034.1 peptidoglycan hydrolase-like protein with peptidoglycan-binding domain [Nocardiopsis mwathae]